MGENTEIKVEGKGIVALKTSSSTMRFLNEVRFVPYLAYNLLSVRNLLTSGYTILFDNARCSIKDKDSSLHLARIHMSSSGMLPLEINNMELLNLINNTLKILLCGMIGVNTSVCTDQLVKCALG